jgi:DnaJ-domain-containing protein 1
MKDAFAVFEIPPRPWLSPETLHDFFMKRAATFHPDSNDDASARSEFLELNAAYQTLKDPVKRLRCFLQIITKGESAQLEKSNADQPQLQLLFAEIAPLKNDLDQFTKKRALATSPVSLALLRHEEQELKNKMSLLNERLRQEWQTCEAELLELDNEWENRSLDSVPFAKRLCTRMSFLQKWTTLLEGISIEA